jgi:hypothetical protein
VRGRETRRIVNEDDLEDLELEEVGEEGRRVYVALVRTLPGKDERASSKRLKVMLLDVCAVTVQGWTS